MSVTTPPAADINDVDQMDPLAPNVRKVVDTTNQSVERIAFSPGEAATAIGCSRKHIYALFASGVLHPYKIGRLTRISADELRALVTAGAAA